MVSPNKTFELIKDEKMREAVRYFIWIAFIYGCISFLALRIFPSLARQKGITGFSVPARSQDDWVLDWFMLIWGAWYAGKYLIVALLWGFWLHLCIVILGERKGIKQTYKIVLYSITPLLFGITIIFQYIASFWILFLQLRGLAVVQGLSDKKACALLLLSVIGFVCLGLAATKIIPSYYLDFLKLFMPFK